MNRDNLDERIRSALAAQAEQIVESDLQPAPVPTGHVPHNAPPAQRWTRRWLPPLLAAAAVIAVAAGTVAVVSVVRADRAQPAHSPTPTPTPTSPSLREIPSKQLSQAPSARTTPAGATPPAAAATPPGASTTATAPATKAGAPASFDLGYQPLWPFANLTGAKAWQAAYRSGGHQPWHLDAGQTALSFTRGYLGFSDIDIVTSSRNDSIGAHVGVGYRDPNGTPRTAAVLHLVRFGTDADSPWEVVGSDDASFSLELPAYGSVVHSPVTVGGHITGVDENIRVTMRQLSGQVGQSCCTPAGGVKQAWSAKVPFSGLTDAVATIVASTGGHLQAVGQFAIQGVRSQ
jgi:hypothetical protein